MTPICTRPARLIPDFLRDGSTFLNGFSCLSILAFRGQSKGEVVQRFGPIARGLISN